MGQFLKESIVSGRIPHKASRMIGKSIELYCT